METKSKNQISSMERFNIHKTITQLFSGEYKFIIPLYQRNFAWGELEITQLLQDLYENYKLGKQYFVGSIIYINRTDQEGRKLEIIDGQQRLTVLTLLINVIGRKLLPNLFASRLEYDSRDEVCQYLESIYTVETSNMDSGINSAVVDTFKIAYNTIQTCSLTPKEDGLSISNLREKDDDKLKEFAEYLSNKVYFVLAEMPQDTDVATYFEIMNNTGDQLKKHEIVKSLVLGAAQGKLSQSQMESLALVWDACSQMDVRIQESIPAEKRELLFGKNFDSFVPENILNLIKDRENVVKEEDKQIKSIIKNDSYKIGETTRDAENDDNQENKGASIIDFSNFLMHIFRLCYNDIYVNSKGKGNDVPLNEKDLLSVFNVINREKEIDAVEFVSKLLYYRIILDRYMVRTEEEDDEAVSRWSLQRPKKHSGSNGVQFTNTFGKGSTDDRGQDNVIKALSMLQVSYPHQKYKRFLNEILSMFSYGTVSYDINWYMPKLNKLILDYIIEIEGNYREDELYALGTRTPRFILNVIDYLLYLSGAPGDFDFRYYNSVEHHLPQSRKRYNNYSSRDIDSIGNLVLLSRRDNSFLKDESPSTKLDKAGNIEKFPPNRKFIYQQTRDCSWGIQQIHSHEEDIRQLLFNKKEILKFRELENSSLLFRACLCVDDYCIYDGVSSGGKRRDFADLGQESGIRAKEKVIKWLNKHPGYVLEDFIEEQLKTNSELIPSTWRWVFVKYPSVVEYCGNGKFAWVKDGKIIYLLPMDRKCDNMHELRTHIVYENLIKQGADVYIDKFGLWFPLKETPFISRFENADVSLHIWVDEDAEHWCYELWSERNGNALENTALTRCGWSKNPEGHYIVNNHPFLCRCPADYEKSVQTAMLHIKKVINIINRVE